MLASPAKGNSVFCKAHVYWVVTTTSTSTVRDQPLLVLSEAGTAPRRAEVEKVQVPRRCVQHPERICRRDVRAHTAKRHTLHTLPILQQLTRFFSRENIYIVLKLYRHYRRYTYSVNIY